MLTKRVRARSTSSSKSEKKSTKSAKIDKKTTPRFSLMRNPYQNGIAKQLRVKMIYCDLIGIDPPVGQSASYVFSANGLYDPNISGGGHQAMGFDQLAALYGEYVVVGSNISVYFQNSQTTGAGVVYGINLCTSATAVQTARYIENGNGVHILSEFNGSGNNTHKLTYACDMNKETYSDVLTDESYAGTASTNPTEQRYYHVWAGPPNYSSDLSSVQCVVTITFDVIWRDRVLTDFS